MPSKSAAIAGLARSLRELAKVPSQVSRDFSDYISEELQNQFLEGRDSYRRPWPALDPQTVKRKGHAMVLRQTDALMLSAKARPLSGHGVGLSAASHGVYHQTTRPVLPNAGLPAEWRAKLKELLSNAVVKHFN